MASCRSGRTVYYNWHQRNLGEGITGEDGPQPAAGCSDIFSKLGQQRTHRAYAGDLTQVTQDFVTYAVRFDRLSSLVHRDREGRHVALRLFPVKVSSSELLYAVILPFGDQIRNGKAGAISIWSMHVCTHLHRGQVEVLQGTVGEAGG